MELESRHQCLIYDGPPSHQLSTLAAMIQRKMDEGFRCLYLNNPAMVTGLRSYLSVIGIDVINEVTQGRLILSSDSCCAEDGSFDVESMLKGLETALDQTLNDGYKGLFATGDMTWEFGSEKNFEKLMEYEYGLEQIFQRRQEIQGICQYHRDLLPPEVARQGLLTHRTVFVNQTLTRFNPHYVPYDLATAALATNPVLDHKIALLCCQ